MAAQLLSVIMPFYNEQATLAEAVSRVLRAGEQLPIAFELILVDDGSTDESFRRIAGAIADERVICVRSPQRTGKGAAVNRGISVSRGDILLVQDADLEYDPRDCAKPLRLILDGRCDFALGSRVLGAGWRRVRTIENRPYYSLTLNAGAWFLTLVFRTLFRVRLTDPTTMMKVFRRECLADLQLVSRGFEWDWEVLCKFVRRGFVPLEEPISYRGRSPEEGKKLRMWRDGWGALIAIFRYRLERRFLLFPQD